MKLCHPERSKITRKANDLAKSRDPLSARSTTTPAAKVRKNAAHSLP